MTSIETNMNFIWYFIFLTGLLQITHESKIPQEEIGAAYWLQSGQEELQLALLQQSLTTEARNVIVFLGDGMGLSTVTAARIYKGQLRGRPGEEERLSFERLPNIALAKTYTVDHQVPDSAATATAILCGVKTRYGTVGLDPRAVRGECSRSNGSNVTCLAQLFQQSGRATGLVTTARITHATPAPLYAAAADRDWEADSDVPAHAARHGCADIAAQLVDKFPGANLNVLFGGGRTNLLPTHTADPEHPGVAGRRHDGRNLIDEWLQDKARRGASARYAWNRRQFDELGDNVDYALGLFESSHMHFDGLREKLGDDEPTLAEMTEKAIKILSRNRKGFFLLVEGARIDHAHHANGARVALEEVLALETAVTRALQLTSATETLVVVTADHGHPLALASYPSRGNNILGLSDYSSDKTGSMESDVDGLPYTTLSYATGPGYMTHYPRADLSHNDTESQQYRQTSAVPLREGSHDGTDVPVYAQGPWAHLLHSTHEQHYLFHVIAHAACLSLPHPQPSHLHSPHSTLAGSAQTPAPHCCLSPQAYDYKTERNVLVDMGDRQRVDFEPVNSRGIRHFQCATNYQTLCLFAMLLVYASTKLFLMETFMFNNKI